MLLAAVPQATVYEYSELARPKHKVCPSAKAREWLSVHSVSKTAPVYFKPDGKLRPCVAAAVALHGTGDGWR